MILHNVQGQASFKDLKELIELSGSEGTVPDRGKREETLERSMS